MSTLSISRKLSGSLDDIRVWNKKQTSEAIYNNYISGINGGANTDDYRTELSVYFKFNEGKTENEDTDKIVLDYSGRLANGYWHDYSTDNRQSGSYTSSEVADPIVRSNHPEVQALLTEMETSGSQYDANSKMSLYGLVPDWMKDEDEENGEELKHIVQIIASYFDKLYAQIEFLTDLKAKIYYQDDEKPLPFARRLLEEKGLVVPDILVNRSIVEYFGKKDLNGIQYEKDIEILKNRIYHNIYNNLEYIYKSKGTEKAYRNMLRCFGIDDEIVKLNLYTDNGKQYLTDKTKHTSQKTKHVDFDEADNFSATVYQENYISGSGAQKLEKNNAITVEAEVLVPKKPDERDSFYYSTPFQSSSVYGLDSYSSTYNYGYTGSGGIENNFQTYLVRDTQESDRAKWVLKQKKFPLVDEDRTVTSDGISFLNAGTSHCGLGFAGSVDFFHSSGSSDGLSISFWSKIEDIGDGFHEIFSIHSRLNNENITLRRDYIGFYNTLGGFFSQTHNYDMTVNYGSWKHYVLSFSSSITSGDGFGFYIDGSPVTIASTSSLNFDLPSMDEFYIGGIWARAVSGSFDDVIIYNKQLNQSEVDELYNSGYGLSSGSIKELTNYGDALSYWTFDNSSDSGIGTVDIELHDEVGDYVLIIADTNDPPDNFAKESHSYATNIVQVTGTVVETEVLTSSFYEEIYNNQRWNLAVRVYPEGYPFAGSFATSSNPNYTIEFYGVSHNFDEVLHEFKLTASLGYETGSALLSAHKKLYVGARRTNWSGSVEAQSDVKIAAASVYYDKLDDQSIKQHNLDPSNYGHNRVFSNPTPFLSTAENTHLPAQHTLALHWDFQTVTASDSSGEFVVEDFSSASVNGRYGWLGNVVTQEHKGVGFGFPVSNTGVVKNEFVFASKKELPEVSFTSDSITIMDQDNEYLYEDEDISDNVFAFEKSMYQVVSEEMLNMFSTIVEYSNLFAKPVDRYRFNYKRLAHAKKLFFEKTSQDLDLDRFTNYYKWIDASISHFLQQLHPASAKFNKGIVETVESHILERPKYQHLLPNIEEQKTIKEQPARGIGELTYDWKHGHAPNYTLEDYNAKAIQIAANSYLQHSNAANYAGTSSIAFWLNPNGLTSQRNIVSFGQNYKINIAPSITTYPNRIYNLPTSAGSLNTPVSYGYLDNDGISFAMHTGLLHDVSSFPSDASSVSFYNIDSGNDVIKVSFSYDTSTPEALYQVYIRDVLGTTRTEDFSLNLDQDFIGFSLKISTNELIISNGDDSQTITTSVVDLSDLDTIQSIRLENIIFIQDFTIWDTPLTANEFSGLYDDNLNVISTFNTLSSSAILDRWALDEELTSFSNGDTVPINTTFSASHGTEGNYLTASSTFLFANDSSPHARYSVTAPAGINIEKRVSSVTYTSDNIRLLDTDNFIVITNDNLNNSDSFKYYVRYPGITKGSVSFTNNTKPDAITGNFQLGYASNEDIFDEVSIWDMVLDDDDIISVYNSGIASNLLNHASASNLVSYYRMGDHPNDNPDRPFKGHQIYDSTGNYNLDIKGNSDSEWVDALAGTTKVITDEANINCLWRKEREERSGTNSTQREQLRIVISSETYVEEVPSFGDNTGGTYVGSTYALRKFSKPYKLNIGEQRAIHGGINYATPKDRDLAKAVMTVHGKKSSIGAPVEALVVGVGEGQGLVDPDPCLDILQSATAKTKYNTTVIVGKFSNLDGSSNITGSNLQEVTTAEYIYNIKGERILPFNLVSGSESTGYNSTVDLNYKKNAILTNLHSDTTDRTNEIPIQGPFTNTWVGGRQSRHVPMNRGTDTYTSRPEEFRLLFGEHPDEAVVDGALGIVGPDYGGPYPDAERPWAIHYRDGRVKRPINVQNHQTTDETQGNYSKNYEVVQTTGRLENNKAIKDLSDTGSFIAKDIGLPATTHETSLIGVVPGSYGNVLSASSNRLTSEIKAFPTNSTGISSTDTVIATRFSAPGGFEVGSEAFLDAHAKEYSVYNSLNFRNLPVLNNSGEELLIRVNSHALRREGLNTLHSRHCGRYGLDSTHGSVSSTDYNAEASFHKIHRNTLVKLTTNKALRMPSTSNSITGIITGDVQSTYPSSGYLSISFWVKLDNGYTSGDAKWILEADDRYGDNALLIQIIDDKLRILLYPVSSNQQYETSTLSNLTSWNHFAIIIDIDDVTTAPVVYLNGDLLSALSDTGGSGTGAMSTIERNLVLMGNDTNAGTAELQGSLQHFAFYNKQLSEDEINEIYTSKNLANTSLKNNIVDYWLLGNELEFQDFSVGEAVTDGLSFNATIGSTRLTIDENIFISEGKYSLATDKNNNFYVQTNLPQSDYNYSWVDSALGDNYNVRSGTQKVFGYWPKNGMLSSSSGFDSAITFPTASTIQGS